MRLFSEKTMESLKEKEVINQTSETELFLINGGLGCSFGTTYQPVSGNDYKPYNSAAALGMAWGGLMTLIFGAFDLSCTL